VAELFEVEKNQFRLTTDLQKLEEGQRHSGGWPWFQTKEPESKVPNDRFVTQTIVSQLGQLRKLGALNLHLNGDALKNENGLERVNRFKLESMVVKALKYLDNEVKDDYQRLLKREQELKDYVKKLEAEKAKKEKEMEKKEKEMTKNEESLNVKDIEKSVKDNLWEEKKQLERRMEELANQVDRLEGEHIPRAEREAKYFMKRNHLSSTQIQYFYMRSFFLDFGFNFRRPQALKPFTYYLGWARKSCLQLDQEEKDEKNSAKIMWRWTR
jgi:DNA repair exonuclease SbcCD ATPase subunit